MKPAGFDLNAERSGFVRKGNYFLEAYVSPLPCEHKPMNAELARYAAKTITLKGKAVSRYGINMIENTEIRK